jgi:multiple sugar transport system ATP-binding protein
MASLTLRGIRKRFGRTDVIRGVDLDDRRRRVRGLCRPVGLRQVHAPAHDRGPGAHHRAARSPRRPPHERGAPAKRGIAMVFQSYALYPHMTVRDNMAFGLKLARRTAS